MRELVIYPTFLCPFSCTFCLTKNKNSYNETLTIDKIKNFLDQYSNEFDKITISGGEPMALKKSYFNELIDTLKVYNKPIIVNSYPYSLDNYREDIEYKLSYDFMARPRALEAWNNLLSFKKPFDLTILISPIIFKYHPNDILKRLSVLPNIKSVEFIPYCKNESSEYDITKNDCLNKFNQILLQSKLNLPYKIINKEKMRAYVIEKPNEDISLCLLPDGNIYYQDFDKRNILKFIKTDESIFNEHKTVQFPEEIDLYSDKMIQWFKDNAI